MQHRVPQGWYCVGSSEIPSGVEERRYFDSAIAVRRRSGRFSARWAEGGGELETREALGLLFVWYPGRGAKATPPSYELPWSRVADPDWHFASAPARHVKVPFERPFCDYFDHWHTRTVHRIPSRNARSWFAEHTCGVEWEARFSVGYVGLPVLDRIPLALRGTSVATLYGLGFAVDELSYVGLSLVNVQTNTPVDPDTIEMRTFAGVRRRRVPSRVARPLCRLLLRTVQREVDKDLVYWRACASRPDMKRDAESDHEMAKFGEWCASLPVGERAEDVETIERSRAS